MCQSGVALFFMLSVGVLLIVPLVSLLVLYSSDAYSQGQQQQALQAYWNARAGVEYFCDQRHGPEGSTYDFAGRGRCVVSADGKDLVFITGRVRAPDWPGCKVSERIAGKYTTDYLKWGVQVLGGNDALAQSIKEAYSF